MEGQTAKRTEQYNVYATDLLLFVSAAEAILRRGGFLKRVGAGARAFADALDENGANG